MPPIPEQLLQGIFHQRKCQSAKQPFRGFRVKDPLQEPSGIRGFHHKPAKPGFRHCSRHPHNHRERYHLLDRLPQVQRRQDLPLRVVLRQPGLYAGEQLTVEELFISAGNNSNILNNHYKKVISGKNHVIILTKEKYFSSNRNYF